MVDSPVLLVLLAIICLCAVVGTIALCLTAADLRRMIRRMNRFSDRANRTAAHFQRMIERSCKIAEDALDEVDLFRKKTHAFWTRYLGNGTRPRSGRLHQGEDKYAD